MAEKLVAGIAQSSSPDQLEDALCSTPNVNCDKLAVITKDAPTTEHEESMVTFMHVGQGHTTTDTAHDVITGTTGILTSMDPNVPNIKMCIRDSLTKIGAAIAAGFGGLAQSFSGGASGIAQGAPCLLYTSAR